MEDAQHVQKWLINSKKILLACGALLFLAFVVFITWQSQLGGFTGSSSETHLNLLKEGWNYMPGVTASPGGLKVTYVGKSIVKQDGSSGQVNFPVNLYGTHLAATGDVAITAAIADVTSGASLRFYEDVPLVQDEFRVEPKGIGISVSGKTLTISSWPGYTGQGVYDQAPVLVGTYALSSDAPTLTVARRGGRTNIAADGRTVVQLSPTESLRSSAIWFGLSADQPGGSWTLKKLEVGASDSRSLARVNTQSTTSYASRDAQTLQALASRKRQGFLVGVAMALSPSVADTQYGRTAFGGTFGSMTTENVLKWQFIHPQPDVYDFTEADALVAIAAKNNLKVHGHTLVFGEANPAWAQNMPTTTDDEKAAVRRTMLDHIQQTTTHFKGRISSWDVVNEPLADTDVSPVGLRQHVWHAAMGEAYIAEAFNAAHRVDPNAKLYINDFGLEADGGRWTAMYDLVSRLKKAGVPIDGVGFEAHVYEAGDEIDPAVLRSHIQALASIGVTSRISEMDVYNDGDATAQAKQYADVLGMCLSEPNCVSWTTWGVSDRYDLSLNDKDQVVHGQDFLWDRDFSPTPSLLALRQILVR